MWEAPWVTDLDGGEETARQAVGTGPGGVLAALLQEVVLPCAGQSRARCASATSSSKASTKLCWLCRASPIVPAQRGPGSLPFAAQCSLAHRAGGYQPPARESSGAAQPAVGVHTQAMLLSQLREPKSLTVRQHVF